MNYNEYMKTINTIIRGLHAAKMQAMTAKKQLEYQDITKRKYNFGWLLDCHETLKTVNDNLESILDKEILK